MLLVRSLLLVAMMLGFNLSYGQTKCCPQAGTADCPMIKNCPKKGTKDCPYVAQATASTKLADCPLAGTPECPLIKNCSKKGTTDCPYVNTVGATASVAAKRANNASLPPCCRKK